MELFWLKNEVNGEVEAFICSNSKLQLDLIARRWCLDSWTLRIGDIALERLSNGESRVETAIIRQLAGEFGLGDGRSKETAVPVSGRIKVSSEERERGLPYWGYSDLLKIAPSSCGNKKARTLQEVMDEPAVLNFRPSGNKPEIPLQLVHRAFGVFWDIFHGVPDSPQPGKDDYQMFLELSTDCSQYLVSENNEYRVKVWESWLEYTGLRLKSPFFTGKIIKETEEDVGYELRVVDGLGRVILALILLVEAKLAMCENKTDPCLRLSQHYRLYWSKVGTCAMFASTCFPALGIEHVGPFIRVSALANLGQVSLQPLTPFMNLLNIQGYDLAAAEAGARLCLATKSALLELGGYYREVIEGSSRRSYFEKGIPYPLHGEGSCPVRWGHKLVYAIPEKQIVVKYVQRDYGKAVHVAWAASGYAPRLLGVQRFPGGWTEIRMEYLGGDWTLLEGLGPTVADSLREKVVEVLKQAHRVPVGDGNAVGVHGDMRDANVMVRLSPPPRRDLLEVKFIDFDWAKVVGGRYPSFMNHAGVKWHRDAGDGKPMLQEHDLYLLSENQLQQTL